MVEKKVVSKGFLFLATLPEQSIAGSAIQLQIKIENQGKEAVRHMSFTKYRDYDLRLLNAAGEPVGATQFGKSMGGGVSALSGSGIMGWFAPGKEFKETLNLARIFDLTVEGQYTLDVSYGTDLKIEKLKFKVIEEPR